MTLAAAMASTPEMTELLGDAAELRALLAFEAALARAEAACGVIPAAPAEAIAAACVPDGFDLAALARDGARAGTVAIPLVRVLAEKVGGSAAGYVHFGATSQDVIDTALVLRLRPALVAIRRDLARARSGAAGLAHTHRATLMLGRTLLQAAPPVTFGLIAAGWVATLDRCDRRLADSAADALVLQFGGAVGTLASLGARGLDVAAALAEALELSLPPLPWHTLRDIQAALACDLAILCGVLGKIARDVSLLSLLGEVAEPGGQGRGGSSTMPHKGNPTASMIALAVATRAPNLAATLLAALPQELQRAVGGWQAEWTAVPDLLHATAAALAAVAEALGGLRVFPEVMQKNLDATGGLPLAEAVSSALVGHVDKATAHAAIQRAVRRAAAGENFAAALAAEPDIAAALTPEQIALLLDPAHYLGSTQAFIDRALGSTHGVR